MEQRRLARRVRPLPYRQRSCRCPRAGPNPWDPGAHRCHAGVRRDHRWHAHPDHVPPGQIRIRRLDVRGRRVRRWWPDGDRREMARRRNRRGIYLAVASAATLRPGWLSFEELGEAHSRELVAAIAWERGMTGSKSTT